MGGLYAARGRACGGARFSARAEILHACLINVVVCRVSVCPVSCCLSCRVTCRVVPLCAVVTVCAGE